MPGHRRGQGLGGARLSGVATETPQQGAATGAVVPGWEARPVPEPVRLAGRHVELVPLTSARYADLFATTCDPALPDLWTYRPVERPSSLAGLWMHLAAVADDPGALTFALVPRTGSSADRASGIASFARIAPEHGVLEIAGVLLGRGLARTAAGTEALHLMLRHAFDDLGYRRVEWKCDTTNEPSRRAALRLGFAFEGTFRRHMVVKGRNRDTAWFAITDRDWPRVAEHHRRWLATENFEGDGRQRERLSELTARA